MGVTQSFLSTDSIIEVDLVILTVVVVSYKYYQEIQDDFSG